MRAGIYIRVSTHEQVMEGYSVGAQTERLKAYCKAKGWLVYDVYTDAGFSGANTDRPALTKLMKDIKSKKINTVVVYKLDRLSRSQKDTLFLIEDVFLKNDVDFVSMNENFDTSSPFGRAMIGILSVFAQLEREQIRERLMMGREERAKDGYWHGGGYDPIGYDYIDNELIINEYEAMQIRKVHDMFQKGVPINRIQKIMKSKHTTKYGSWNHHSTVRNALTQPIYTGKIEWDGKMYEGRHKPIIDDETFNRSLKRYNEISWTRGDGKHKKRPFQAKHVLTGLVYCGNCGARYFAKGNYSGRGENRKYRPYYTCYSRAKSAKNMIIDPNCRNKTYAQVDLDKIIFDEILTLSFNPSFIHQIENDEVEEATNDNEVIEQRIKETDGQIARLLDLYQLGNMPIDNITDRIDQLNKEKAILSEQLVVEVDDAEPTISTDEAERILLNAESILKDGELIKKRELVHSLIDEIIIDEEKLSIHWAFA